MVSVDDYTSLGYVLELLAQSECHRQFELGDYFCTEILPPLSCNQVRFYVTPEGWPTAMLTWAWLSEQVERDVHATGRALGKEEWASGDRLFFNDWVTPYGNIREVLHDMTHHHFPNEVATSLRRRHDGSVHSINRWTGVNFRRKKRGTSKFSHQRYEGVSGKV
ncbi:toxin-activating lysine-acyltransferase [Halomonas maura]|uniref:toxin-activating lysine-acyltransferase n=1 Tax=Halomonas maura TaxID=117606 RepID=UPI0025B6138B|nr:toxin-activating lysine-acyltransferase [Halomonas maura]MDN3557807.1 toxin-activating lysine-acyltransferase [Halomonas maura]